MEDLQGVQASRLCCPKKAKCDHQPLGTSRREIYAEQMGGKRVTVCGVRQSLTQREPLINDVRASDTQSMKTQLMCPRDQALGTSSNVGRVTFSLAPRRKASKSVWKKAALNAMSSISL